MLQQHQNIELHVEYFYVKGLRSLQTELSNINLLTVLTGGNTPKNNIETGIVHVIKIYLKIGFKVTAVYGDIESDLDNVKKINTTSNNASKIQKRT